MSVGGNRARRIAAAIVVAACAATVAATATQAGAAAKRPHVTRPRKLTAPRGSAAQSAPSAIGTRAAVAAAATPHLTYHGGVLLQNVKINAVAWNRWRYDASVPFTGTRSVASFLNGLVQSPHVDWLDEYDTPNYKIRHGHLDGVNTIKVNPDRNGDVITNAQIQRELAWQIRNGKLPAPDDNRLYVLFIPPGHKIAAGGANSRKNFCAYHDAMMYGQGYAYYAVMPYEVNNTGCRAGSAFDSLTNITAHEVLEAMTDAGTGLFNNGGWWDDSTGDEIADICAWKYDYVTFADGQRYLVQKEWSNAAEQCVLLPPPPRQPVPSPACTAPTTKGVIKPGECLKPNTTWVSPGLGFTLWQRSDGGLVLMGGVGALWNSGTYNKVVTEAVMQTDGNFAIWGPYGAIWSTNTAGRGATGLYIQENGNLVVYGPAGALWSSGSSGCGHPSLVDTMLVNQCLAATGVLHSADGRYRFTVQSDGNVVLYGPSGSALWATNTARVGTPQSLTLQSNGDLTLVGITNGASLMWHSNTAGQSVAKLTVRNDGNVVVTSPSGAVVWQTGTAGRL